MRFFRNARHTSTCDQRGTSVELVQELTKTILKLYQYCLFKTFHDHSNSIDTLQAIIFSPGRHAKRVLTLAQHALNSKNDGWGLRQRVGNRSDVRHNPAK